MTVPGPRRLERWMRRPNPAVLVLLYHRVAEADIDPWGLCVTPRHFGEHLDVMRRFGPVLSLADVVRALKSGSLPRRALVVTFDDGYADNLYAAKPLLERYGTPAMIFVSTGGVDSEREFWWDELEHVVLGPHVLPRTLHLVVSGTPFEWEVEDEAAAVETPRSWLAWQAPPTARHALYYSLWQLLIEQPDEEQQAALASLREWAGEGRDSRVSRRPMTTEEVVDFAASPILEIGAHTVTHPALPALPVARQRGEIADSQRFLEDLLGRPVSAFSYPYGRYAAETRALVEQAGFTSSCTTDPRPVRSETDPFLLPRTQVFDGDGDALARCIDDWFRSP